ncbi:PREDICTED: nascent polypeptide-associated complex subunit alpha, muscle-specific form-like, partial [Rhagoletis zephyria]|uniref:nascent polypeptide-associated complex subunit alpha, muscle-specific form-like n=1 Tax=Rhagoletis zephyria TaxID=28612 RepID=UPI0008114338
MTSNSPPPQSGSRPDNTTSPSPFRSLLSSPLLIRQRATIAARTSSATSSVSSPASPQPPPPRPASVLPSFLGSPLTPPPHHHTSAAAAAASQSDDSDTVREQNPKRRESATPPACSSTARTPTPGGETI